MTTDPPDPPEVESVKLWAELEVEAARLGAAYARFDNAKSAFTRHQQHHGFVDEKNRALPPVSRPSSRG